MKVSNKRWKDFSVLVAVIVGLVTIVSTVQTIQLNHLELSKSNSKKEGENKSIVDSAQSNFQIGILPFDYRCSKEYNLEGVLVDKLRNLAEEEHLSIAVKHFQELESPKNFDEARDLTLKLNTDLVIYGAYLEDCGDSTSIDFKFVLAEEKEKDYPLKEGTTGLKS